MDAGTVEATLRLKDEFAPTLNRARNALGQFIKQTDGIGAGSKGGFGRMIDQADELSRGLTRAGMAVSIGVGVPLAATIKIASDFESAFSNVVKTAEGFDVDAFGKLNPAAAKFREEIRAMAREIPMTANELANIAAVGGQFGVKAPELAKFTKVVANLAVAVDGISAENAAGALQQIREIVGRTSTDFERLASTLVDLGNKGTSTEATILETTRRFASAGASAKVTAQDIMGMSAAVANLGYEAEVGGTVLSKTFLEIQTAVQTGGADLEKFANLTKMSAADFQKAWGQDATGTFQKIIGSFSELQKSGQGMAVTMQDLFGKDIRQNQILTSLALNTDNLATSLNNARNAYQANTALADEAKKKYATFENQVKLLGNQVKDVAITLGDSLLPALRNVVSASSPVVNTIGEMAKLFNALPSSVRTAVMSLGLGVGLAGILMVVAGKAIEGAKHVSDLINVIRGLSAAQGAAGAVGALSGSVGGLAGNVAKLRALLPAGGLVTLVGAAGFVAASRGIDQYRTSLGSLTDQMEIKAFATSVTGKKVDDFNQAWQIANSTIEKSRLVTGKLSDEQTRLKGLLDATNPAFGDAAKKGTELKDSLAGVAGAVPKINVAVGAAAAVTGTDYVKALSDAKKQADALEPSVRAQILAFLEQGGTVTEASKTFGLAEGVLRHVTEQQKEGAKAAKAHTDELTKLNDQARQLSENARLTSIGFFDIEEAARTADAISKLPEGFVMTRDAADDANDVITKGMRAAAKLGLPIDKAMTNAAKATGKVTTNVKDLSNAFDMASVAGQKIDLSISPSYDQVAAQMKTNADAAVDAYVRALKSNGNVEDIQAAWEDLFSGPAKQGSAWGEIGRNMKGVAGNITGTIAAAFTGGGGLEGALKSIGVQIVASISEPLIKGLQKMTRSVQAAVGVGASAAGTIGAAWGGQTAGMIGSTTGAIAGAALATTSLGTAAATSTTAALALGAATAGIGLAAVGVYMLARHYFTVSKAVKEARKDVAEFQQELWKTMTTNQKVEAQGHEWAATLITVRDAYLRMGLGAEVAERSVAKLLNTDNPEEARKAMVEINQIVGAFQANLKAANDKFTPLLEQADELGVRLPDSLLMAIQRLRDMGDLTEENIALFDKLLGAKDVDYDKFGEAAKRYGINEDALGIGYKQFQSDKTTQQMIDDFDILIRGGASVGTVLHGMREEISKVVADSQKFGTTIPENMRPWITELARTGQLVDANGQAITDLSKLNFGDAMKTSVEKITDSLQELVDVLKGPFLDALRNLPTSIDIPVNVPVNGGGPNGGDHSQGPTPLARGGILNRPTFVAGEAGAEIVSPLDDYHDAMIRSFQAGGSGGRPAIINLNVDGQTFARVFLPYLADEMTIQGI